MPIKSVFIFRSIPIVVLLTALAGCPPVDVVNGPEPPTDEPATIDEPQGNGPVVVDPPVIDEPEDPPEPPLTIPDVIIVGPLRETCLVFVDDQVPAGELPDLDGQMHSVHDLLGEKFTILFFWSSGNMHSVVQLEELARDLAGLAAAQGGRIVAVNVDDTAEKAKEVAATANADFLILLDPERAYFSKLATKQLPRTYVLDPEGKILWFDLEYSSSTERDLKQTIDVILMEDPPP